MKKLILFTVLIISFFTQYSIGQDVNAKSITFKNEGTNNNYTILKSGGVGIGGLLHTKVPSVYGNGDDLVMYSWGNKDLNLDAIDGNINFYPSASDQKFRFTKEGHLYSAGNFYPQGTVYIGASGNKRLYTRHIDGKKSNSTAVDHLYINYNNGKNVYVGGGSATNQLKSKLYVNGNIISKTSISSYAGDANKGVTIAHGGTHSFVNAFGGGNLDLRYQGSNRVSITNAEIINHKLTTHLDGIQLDGETIHSWDDVSGTWDHNATSDIQLNTNKIIFANGSYISGGTSNSGVGDVNIDGNLIFTNPGSSIEGTGVTANLQSVYAAANLGATSVLTDRLYLGTDFSSGDYADSWETLAQKVSPFISGSGSGGDWDHVADDDIVLQNNIIKKSVSSTEGIKMIDNASFIMPEIKTTYVSKSPVLKLNGTAGSMHIGTVKTAGESNANNFKGAIWFDQLQNWGGYDMEFFKDKISINQKTNVNGLLVQNRTTNGAGGVDITSSSCSACGNRPAFKINHDGNVDILSPKNGGSKLSIFDNTIVLGHGVDASGNIPVDQQTVVAGTLVINYSGERGADYVFEEEYMDKMPTLLDVEKHILENKHLHDFPKAKEYEDNYDVMKMNMKLLEKIEELYLYTIEQEKRIISLEKSKN